MKKTDIAMIILIASVSVLVAFFAARAIPFFQIDEQNTTVPTIESIPVGISEDIEPSPTVFNDDAINPTVKTVIGKTE